MPPHCLLCESVNVNHCGWKCAWVSVLFLSGKSTRQERLLNQWAWKFHVTQNWHRWLFLDCVTSNHWTGSFDFTLLQLCLKVGAPFPCWCPHRVKFWKKKSQQKRTQDVFHPKSLQLEILCMGKIPHAKGNALVSFTTQDIIKTACFYVQLSTTWMYLTD